MRSLHVAFVLCALALPAAAGPVRKPESGWTAFFVELVFESGDAKAPYKFTTQVQVVPDLLPHSFEEFRKSLK